MHRALLLLSFLLLSYQTASSQSLQGKITDASTGIALTGATIFVPAAQTGDAADADGRYAVALPGPGTYRVVFSFVGYQSETRTAAVGQGATTIDVALRPSAVEAPPVTVTAKAEASDILSTPQAVAVLEAKALAENRGAAALDALSHVAGVHLLRTGQGVAKPVIRGLTSQRVLVVENGIRQEGQQWGDEHGPELDAFDIHRIEVVKGPMSLLYGSDALGGVIQARSLDPFTYTQPLTGLAVLQGMSNSMLGAAHLELGGRSGAYAYQAYGTVKRAGNYETPDGRVPNTGLGESNGALRLGRKFGRGNVLAEYQHFGARLGFFEPDAIADLPTERFTIGLPFQRVSHDRFRLESELPSSLGRFNVVAAWQQNKRKEFSDEDDPGTEANVGNSALRAAAELDDPSLYLRLTTLTGNVQFHHKPIGRLYGTIGFSGLLQHNETLAEEPLIPGARTVNGGVFLYEEYTLPRLTIDGGIRYDARQLDVDANEELGVTEQTRTYQALSGALGLAWQPVGGLSLALNVGHAWRAPVLAELFANGVHEGTIRYEQGDPTLVPEKSRSLDATLRWLSPHAYVEVNAFVNHIDDFIYPQLTDQKDPASGFFIYPFEQAAARLWGGEFTSDIHPHPFDWLHVRLSGDVTLTRNLETADPLPLSPPPRLGALAGVEKGKLGPVHDFSLGVGPTVAFDQHRVAPLEQPTGGYTLWEASASGTWQLPNAAVTTVLSVDNIFDTAYVSHLSRFRPYGILNPGRNVRLEIQVKLP